MFEEIVDPLSLREMSATERRKFRIRVGIGTFLFFLGVLLQLAHSYLSSPLFGHVRGVVILLMTAGIGFEFWGASVCSSAQYHDSGTTVLKH